MRRRKGINFIIKCITCLTMGIFLLQPIAAEASDLTNQEAYDMGAMVGALDTTQTGSIEVTEKYGSGISYSLYQIATFSEDGHGYYTEPFYKYKSDLTIAPAEAKTSTEIEKLAESFVSIVEKNAISANAVKETGASGKLTFSDLTPGYYLLTAASFTNDEGLVYSANPILVSIPGSGENGSYHVLVESKSEMTTPTTESESDATTATESDTTDASSTSTSSSDSSDSSGSSGSSGSSSSSSSTLPQTGQLWWPIPVLAAAGMLFYLSGYMLEVRRRRRDETR